MKEEIKFSLIVIFQIFLMMNFIVAQSYIIGGFDDSITITDKPKELIEFGVNMLINFLSIKQIGFVSAYCCEKTKDDGLGNGGAWCQESDIGDCDTSGDLNALNIDCDNTNYCEDGWCIDDEGLCGNSRRAPCVEGGGAWSITESADCVKGCCKLGPNTQFREEAWCKNKGGEFDDSTIETECAYDSPDIQGACVYEVQGEKKCTFESEDFCLQRVDYDSFDADFLCAHPDIKDLGVDCEEQKSINCDNGKIYWFDSCGNRENVYIGNNPTEKSKSWNLGIFEEIERCTFNPTDPNSVKTCGYCAEGTSTCKSTESGEIHVDEDNFVCKDLGCNDGIRDWKNEESWCVYEGPIGEQEVNSVKFSTDIPGSNHYKKICNQGEIETIRCDGSYRKEICGEEESEVYGETFSTAECRLNNADICLSLDDMDECESEPDCRVQSVDAADYFKFDVCVPRYPKGFNPKKYSEGGFEDGAAVCGLASIPCTVVSQVLLVKHCAGNPCAAAGINCAVCWYTKSETQVIANKECSTNPEKFYRQMNDLCVSIGDCGGYINLEGKYEGRTDLEKRYEDIDLNDIDPPFYAILLTDRQSTVDVIFNFIANNRGDTPRDVSGFAENELNNFRILNGAIGTAFYFVPGWGWIVSIVAVAIEGAIQIFYGDNVGETSERDIVFTCSQWEPPAGGDDCNKCGEGEFPCTEYKCLSLGLGCDILPNEDGSETDKPICYYRWDNPIAPVIEFDNLQTGYKSSETSSGVNITPDGGGCVEGNAHINFSLITDEGEEEKYARCRWGYNQSNYNDYKTDWTNFPNAGNVWAKEHDFTVVIPYWENDFVVNGELELYFRCENHNGKANVNNYVVNLCVEETPDYEVPIIEEFEPASGSYLSYGSDTLDNLIVYTDEPVLDCRYSLTDRSYEDMDNGENHMICDLPDPQKLKYECKLPTLTQITGLTEPTNTIYFRCNDTHGNAMIRSEEYIISQSQGPLIIDSTRPSGAKLIGGSSTIYDSVSLEVTTSGGAYGDVADCEWNYN